MDMVRAGLRFNDFNTFLFAQLAQYLPYILFDLTVKDVYKRQVDRPIRGPLRGFASIMPF